MDVNMNQNLDQLIVGPLVYNPPATGWTRPLIRANHNAEVIQFMDAHSPSCIAVIILASDFLNRESAPAAIKAIFQAHSIADVDMIDPLPAIPKVVDAATNTLPFGTPWTHIERHGKLEVSAMVRRRIPRGPTIPIPATRIIFPPFDRDPDVNENFRRHVLSTNFSFAVPLRGTGTPWLGPNPLAPKLIECTECHSSDHYTEDCPILNSDAYHNARGIAPHLRLLTTRSEAHSVEADVDLFAGASADMVVAADAGVLVAEMVTVIHRTTRELITCLFLFPTHAHLRSL
ncbi:hypothetical protein B0H13DRAFT_2676402 [Mycena leptocephala]|nr:hypothetical protein B0H13DRAFT_2676402 [Mycena leptocephala]